MTIISLPTPKLVTSNDIPVSGSLDEIVEEFAVQRECDLRYVAQWGKWLHWDGTRWEFEPTLLVFDIARLLVRKYASAKDPDLAHPNVWAAVERGARSDRRLAATPKIWDTDPWLLNTPGGIVDLRTGKLLPHDPMKYMTKITAVAPGGDGCPLWLSFLARVTGENYELQSFLQRVAGYSSTGITREHALFFLYGRGRNGKGVWLNTTSAILGDYAATAPMQTFMATKNEQHPTDLAMLRGARMVTSQEIEKNQRWAESKVKSLTGGDRITARFMRQDFFSYTPEFKLNIGGNHKPALHGVDEAIRGRMNLVPFTVTIPPKERDPDLPEKLKHEWPAILQWMINGCLAWQRMGLAQPAIVSEATEEYLTAEDALERWIGECCVTGPDKRCSAKLLWECWKRWSESANEYVGSQTKFGFALTERGYGTEKSYDVQRVGIDLKPYVPTGGIDFNNAPPQAME
jgi:putative DNA primase/helicase